MLRLGAVNASLADAADLFAMARDEDDEQTLIAVEGDAQQVERQVADLEFRRMFSNPADPNNCFVGIQAGAGGTEAQDWASMLLRQYLRYCERKGFKTELLEESDGSTVRRTLLPGGVRVITEKVPGVRSAAFGVWVGAGSRDESKATTGSAHFLEHLLFKGTRRRTAMEISAEIEAVRSWLSGRAMSIYGGSVEVQNNIISKRILGLPDTTQSA